MSEPGTPASSVKFRRMRRWPAFARGGGLAVRPETSAGPEIGATYLSSLRRSSLMPLA
jgi:hypothetical protein